MNREINIQINPLSDIALYEQIAEQLKQLIVSGTLAEHAPLPSVRGLAQALEVSVITTRRAYTELEQQGYVITTPAKGTFVSYRYKNRLKELGLLKLDEILSNAAYLAQALQIDEQELLKKLSAHCARAQEHTYTDPGQTRQLLTQFIRSR
ncbi:MAG: GntR family transcriptional regulator [Peptococcaceae bacterium]|nr:GntR family transcriptional regulator [Peptococcaceae bacterium]